MRPLQRGEDPREVLRRHKERGSQQYTYTYEDIARITGLTVATLRSDPKLDISDLRSVALRIVRSMTKQATVLTDDEVAGLFPAVAERWRGRYPRVRAYRCGYPGCKAVGAERLCSVHKVAPLTLSLELDEEGGSYMELANCDPLHRVICPAKGKDVHHVDGNKWNNHPSNLEPLNHAEHWAVHQANAVDNLSTGIKAKP